VALFAHCFTCGKDLGSAVRVSGELARRGFLVMRFDFTGLGESEGDFADTTVSSNIEDLVAAADWLRRTHAAPSVLVGHSLGGAAVIAATSQIPEVRAVATIGAPSDPSHVTNVLADDIETIERDGQATVSLAGRPFQVRQAFLDDVREQSLAKHLSEMRASLLVMHSPQDLTVGIENASAIYTAARHPKSFITLDGADHLLGRRKDAIYVGEVVAAWASRYLPDREAPKRAKHSNDVEVYAGPEGFLNQVVARSHHWLADEPTDVGGTDAGPTPYELLLAALGTCTSITMRMYASRKKWPLRDITVHLRHSKTPGDDGKPVDHISREIQMDGDLTDEQRVRMLAIADRCPVHRTLHSEVVVNTVEV
jgi:putative redox protein